MMNNVERWAQEPRVVGSANLERIRAEVIAEIEGMGLSPTVQTVWYSRDEVIAVQASLGLAGGIGGRFFALPPELPVVNIFVELPSPRTDRGIMFVSHLDSWPGSPGAADAMVPVTAMLEAMRAHAGNENLANSIYFLITDGEEFAHIGALAFIRERPELQDRIDMIVNMDAQGNSGGLILYETSPNPYAMLNVFRRAVPRPIGMSVGAQIYAWMNTSTDFTFFKRYGWSGINLAIIEGLERYHTPTDTYDTLNRSTAWHYLTTTLGLANYAANNPLDELRAPSTRAVFFTLLPGNLVILSYLWAYILCAVACLLALAYIVLSRKKKRLKASPQIIVMLTLIILSIISAIFFHTGSYLVWLPLLAMSICAFLEKRPAAYRVAWMLSLIITLLLWVPLIYAGLIFLPFV